MYRVAEMEDVLFGTFEDLSKVLDVYLNKKNNNNKTPIWVKDFEHSYAIIDDKKVVMDYICMLEKLLIKRAKINKLDL